MLTAHSKRQYVGLQWYVDTTGHAYLLPMHIKESDVLIEPAPWPAKQQVSLRRN